jgi:hypothetical protein
MATSKSVAPKIVLIAPYMAMNWLYEPLIPEMRKKYGTKFILMLPEAVKTEKFSRWLSDQDEIITIPNWAAMAQRRGLPPSAEIELANRNQNLYGVRYRIDIYQQERAEAARQVSGVNPCLVNQHGSLGENGNIATTNGFFDFFEILFTNKKIDLCMVWPRSGAEAVCAYVATQRNVLVTYPYTAKYKHFAYWATGPFSTNLQHKLAYDSCEDGDPIALENVTAPGRPAWLEQSKIHKRYSWFSVIRKVAIELMNTTHFIAHDIAHSELGKNKRVPLYRRIYKLVYDANYYRSFNRICIDDLDALKRRPYVFFAFQNEPEFSVQGRCKEYNDQFSIVRQIALSLPPGINIIIKEHAWVGDKKVSAYAELLNLDNVKMAHPGFRALDFIPDAEAVASVAGTVTLEAAYYGKRALIFTPRSEFTFMPHVRVVANLALMPRDLIWLLEKLSDEHRRSIQVAASRFCRAVEAIGFDAPTFYTKSNEPIAADEIEKSLMSLRKLMALHQKYPLLGEDEIWNLRGRSH